MFSFTMIDDETQEVSICRFTSALARDNIAAFIQEIPGVTLLACEDFNGQDINLVD